MKAQRHEKVSFHHHSPVIAPCRFHSAGSGASPCLGGCGPDVSDKRFRSCLPAGNWLFDDIFTNAILSDLELDAASLATTIGQEKIREGAFAYLANFNYFTLIETGGKRLKITAKDFKASLRDGRLVYDFTVPLNLPLTR